MAFTTALAQVSLLQNRTQFHALYDPFMTATFSCNPASINSAAKDSGTITVKGLKLGDMVVGWSADQDLLGATVFFYVSAADTLTMYITNSTGVAVDLAAGNWKVLIGRPTW
jgi:hypothetical protein